MRKILFGTMLLLLLAVVALLAVMLVFNLPPVIAHLFNGEWALIKSLNQFSKGVFHKWYWLHNALLIIVFIAGLYALLKPFIKWCGQRYNQLPAYQQHKKAYLTTAAWLLALVFFIVLLSIAEANMRKALAPGQAFGTFRPQDSLVLEQRILCDSMGVNHQNPAYNWNDTLKVVNAQGYFATFNYTLQVADSLRRAGKKIVFIIGDSFTEGVTATGFDKTFVEVLRNMQQDYVVFGFGVSGTDPLQYELVTRKFIHLKPDMLVVAFCGQNDMVDYDRQPSPGVPILWQTNAGWLDSNVPAVFAGQPNVILKSHQEAYNYYLQKASLVNRKGLGAKFFGSLQLTTKLYFLPLTYKYRIKPMLTKAPDNVYKNLNAIDSIAVANQVAFAIAFVPNMDYVHKLKTREHYLDKYGHVFKNLQPRTHFPLNYTKNDFLNPDIHFNDEGNRKFALFVDSLVRSNIDL